MPTNSYTGPRLLSLHIDLLTTFSVANLVTNLYIFCNQAQIGLQTENLTQICCTFAYVQI